MTGRMTISNAGSYVDEQKVNGVMKNVFLGMMKMWKYRVWYVWRYCLSNYPWSCQTGQ